MIRFRNWRRVGNSVTLVALLALALFPVTGSYAAGQGAGTTWHKASKPPTGIWDGITYGNGRFVAVSGDRSAMYSSDGVAWKKAMTPGGHWGSVAFGNGHFVAVAFGSGAGAHGMTSEDGITWRSLTTPLGHWMKVIFANHRFVAVGGGGHAMYSPDGTTWTVSSGVPNAFWRSVAYGKGKFVAVSNYGSDPVMYSSDGISWTLEPSAPTGYWEDITFGGGKFVAISAYQNPMYSTDGITWEMGTAEEGSNAVAFGGLIFISVADSRVERSTDGMTWSPVANPRKGYWNAIAFARGRFVAVGYSQSSGKVMYSGSLR